MNLTQEKALFHLTGKLDFIHLRVETLQNIADEHPYFAPAQYFLTSKIIMIGNSLAVPQSVRTNFYFTNPYWLQFQLKHGLKNVADTSPASGPQNNNLPTGFTIPTVEAVKEIMRKIDYSQETPAQPEETATDEYITESFVPGNTESANKISGLLSGQLADFKKPVEADAKLDIDSISERLHTIDYFASQGIKIDLANIPQDKLTIHLRKFTDWLKQMKQAEGKSQDLGTNLEMENAVAETAKNSNKTREILTETMADVLVKQGQVEKAIQLYIKLSFINPEKSSYFAAKIEQLKGI